MHVYAVSHMHGRWRRNADCDHKMAAIGWLVWRYIIINRQKCMEMYVVHNLMIIPASGRDVEFVSPGLSDYHIIVMIVTRTLLGVCIVVRSFYLTLINLISRSSRRLSRYHLI